ncbi:YlbF family regulator [Clostridium sp. CS001]|uniref:YlbF family regulator n=1 Tax=Clostridium sp. CS001 TaxID=2880648 RepID=UPI001CF1582C|nr:YlbF family regulator [Clostridium sp. CS001]MCB2288238.1 YlbF family regulator [Clostridium sp. CS001]
MNIYDNAHEFAKSLKDCHEIVELREVAKKIASDEKSKKMLADFRKVQIEAYTEQMQTGEMKKETLEKLQNLGAVVSLNPDVAKYFQAEATFGTMWDDVMKILNDAIGVDLSFGNNQ